MRFSIEGSNVAFGRAVLRLGALASLLVLAAGLVRSRAAVASELETVEVGLQHLVADRPLARRIVLNGAVMQVGVERVPLPVIETLDREEQRCVESAFGAESARWTRLGLAPVLRSGRVLVCFVPEHPWRSAASLLEAAIGFGRTADLGSIGRVAFVWARPTEDGTSLLRLVSEGALRLGDMFPARGDVPGADPEELPRPPSGRRVLAAEEPGADPRLVAFTSPWPAERLVRWYRERAAASGFGSSEVVRAGGVASLLLRRADDVAVVAIDASVAPAVVAIARLR